MNDVSKKRNDLCCLINHTACLLRIYLRILRRLSPNIFVCMCVCAVAKTEENGKTNNLPNGKFRPGIVTMFFCFSLVSWLTSP